MNISLQFEPLDCSFHDYAVQPSSTPPKPIEDHSLKKQKQALRCLHAIDELLQTERDYTNHLTHLVEVCFGHILQRQKWILDKHKEVIVRNAKELLEFHKVLLIALEDAYMNKDIVARCGHIATVFLNIGSSFTLYDTYCDKHDAAIALCNDYRSKPEWAIFTKDCATLYHDDHQPHHQHHHIQPNRLDPSATKPLHFEDYLIKPVQRVCRYQLLLKEILQYTPRATAEYRRLDCALGMMQAVVAGIDRRKYHRDTTERTKLFIDRLDTSSSSVGKLDKDSLHLLGNLVISGAIDVTYSSLGQTTVSSSRSKYLGCFVFPTYLILVRPKKVTNYVPKHWFPLRLVEVEDLQDINDQREHAFVVRCKKHCFAFTATCQREKRLWISKLSQAITAAKSQPRSVDNFIVSSLHGVVKPTKLRTSRSVTNLLDFGRDSFSSAPSYCTTTAHWLQSSENENQRQEEEHISGNKNDDEDTNNMKRSKSLSFQLASYYKSSDDTSSTTSSHPSSLKLPPLPSPTTFYQQNHSPVTPVTPVTPVAPVAPVAPTVPLSCSSSTSIPSTALLKRHSADFSPRSKKREQLKSRIHSEMYIKPIDLNDPSAKLQRRPGSMDLMSTSSSQLSLNMIGKIKNNHQHALRIASDHKLREVCTQDYLSSRSWSTLLRESSNGQSYYSNTSNHNDNSNNSGSSSSSSNNSGRRKSSLSNLRSSSSSLSMLIIPSRRVSDGGSSQSTTRSNTINNNNSANSILLNGSSIDNTSSMISSSASTIDENSRLWKSSPPPPSLTPESQLSTPLCYQHHHGHKRQQPHRHRQELPSHSRYQKQCQSKQQQQSVHPLVIQERGRTGSGKSVSKIPKSTRSSVPLSSDASLSSVTTCSYGSSDFQQYYCDKYTQQCNNDMIGNVNPSHSFSTMLDRTGSQHFHQTSPQQGTKKKTLRSSLSSYSLHIQPLKTNVKHAFVDSFRRFSPNQNNHQPTHHPDKQRQHDSYLYEPVDRHHHRTNTTKISFRQDYYQVSSISQPPSPLQPASQRNHVTTKRSSRLFSWMKHDDHARKPYTINVDGTRGLSSSISSNHLRPRSTTAGTIAMAMSSNSNIIDMAGKPPSFSFSSTPAVMQNNSNKSNWTRKWLSSKK